jgi:hypothetical protein
VFVRLDDRILSSVERSIFVGVDQCRAIVTQFDRVATFNIDNGLFSCIDDVREQEDNDEHDDKPIEHLQQSSRVLFTFGECAALEKTRTQQGNRKRNMCLSSIDSTNESDGRSLKDKIEHDGYRRR